jgi:hypothetical protein
MVEGGLDGGFFAIYTPQGPRTPEATRAARDAALIRGVEIREMVAKHGDKFGLALKADDAAAIAAQGKRVVFMSVENSYPMDGDVTLLSTFYALGVRISGLAHFKNNDMADSSTDKPEWHGLSPLGKTVRGRGQPPGRGAGRLALVRRRAGPADRPVQDPGDPDTLGLQGGVQPSAQCRRRPHQGPGRQRRGDPGRCLFQLPDRHAQEPRPRGGDVRPDGQGGRAQQDERGANAPASWPSAPPSTPSGR